MDFLSFLSLSLWSLSLSLISYRPIAVRHLQLALRCNRLIRCKFRLLTLRYMRCNITEQKSLWESNSCLSSQEILAVCGILTFITAFTEVRNTYCYSVHKLLFSSTFSEEPNSGLRAIVFPNILCGCETQSHTSKKNNYGGLVRIVKSRTFHIQSKCV